MQDILQVGAVTSPHGLAGEVKVFPTTDDPARFKKLKSVLVEECALHPQMKENKSLQMLRIERVRFFKNLVILKFQGLDRIEDVEGLRGQALYVTREDAVPLEEGEYFIADLIGLSVYADEPFDAKIFRKNIQSDSASDSNFTQLAQEDTAEKSIGTIENMKMEITTETIEKAEMEYGQRYFLGKLTDVLQTGANDVYEVKLTDGREVLIPAIRQCILEVDLDAGTMLVHLLEGLLE